MFGTFSIASAEYGGILSTAISIVLIAGKKAYLFANGSCSYLYLTTVKATLLNTNTTEANLLTK